jgi:ankyrin repeat protein
MEKTLTIHLDDVESLAESDFTDGLESSDEYDFDFDFDFDNDDDDDCDGDSDDEDNRDNPDECLDEDERNLDCNAEILKDFTYADEGKIYADGHAIRLLRLLGGTGPIQGFLFKAFLHKTGNGLNGMPYEALSYTWGTNKKTRQIVLNSERFMVTDNLYLALQYLRFKKEDRILWIDAICIDQSHIPERNHQVSHMASIYQDADRVLFWLGEPTYDTSLLISSLTRLQARASDVPNISLENTHDSRLKTLWNDEILFEDSCTLLKGLLSLLARPWFKRSWILQEVCFAQTGVVVCGTQTIPAHVFALTPWLLDLQPAAHCKGVLQMMPGATRLTRTFLSGREMRNFYSLLQRFYRSEASDPRDQVYALLSMATDSNTAGFPVVDYGSRFEEVVESIFTYLFPNSWERCGRSHGYESISEFVEDFPRLKGDEIKAADDDVLLKVRLFDDTELTQLHQVHHHRAFEIAVQTGNDQLLQNLLRFPDIDLNGKWHSYKVKGHGSTSSCLLPPLCAAAAYGFTDVVKLLAEDFRLDDIDSVDTEYRRTPLLWAAARGHMAVVKLLLATGKAEVNLRDKFDQTPLLLGAASGHRAVVKLLLTTGKAKVNLRDMFDRTPLLRAAENGHDAVVELLLTIGKAEVDLKDNSGLTPLLWAAENGHEAVVRLLLTTGKAEVDLEDTSRQNLLMWAAKNGHEAIANLLLIRGNVEVNFRDEYGRTLLSRAAENGHEAVVELLLATGKAEVNLRDEFDRTPLLRAAENGHVAVVEILLRTGKAEVNLRDKFSRMSLLRAAKNGHEAAVKLLLATGVADVDLEDTSRQTLLLWAAKNGHEDVAKLLLIRGSVDVNIRDGYGRTLLSLAAEKGHEAVVKLLLMTGKAHVNSKDTVGRTPLSWAASSGHESVVKLLLATGKVIVDLRDMSLQTPLSLAATNGHEAVVKLLLIKGKAKVDLKDNLV